MLRLLAVIAVALGVCQSARADEKYSFHENLHPGMKEPFVMTCDFKVKSATVIGGSSTSDDTSTHFDWSGTLDVLEVKDGSGTREHIKIDASSTDTTTKAGEAPQKSTCPFAGHTITLLKNPDETFTDDYSGKASDLELNVLNDFIGPDEDFYPDGPVAVGDSWDNTAKLSRHSQLEPGDHLLSECRLDWVKTINNRRIAQISNSQAIVYHEPGDLEEDYECTTTAIVDLATQMIVTVDQTASSTYKSASKAKIQVTGGTQSKFHCGIQVN